MVHQQTKPRVSRKQRREQIRRLVNEEGIGIGRLNFDLQHVSPLTENQHLTFNAWEEDKNLLMTGTAGTGKSFLALHLAMRSVIEEETHSRVIIIRSIVPSRSIGFLPGNAKEKSKSYEAPYYSIFSELFGRGDAYEYLKNKKIVEFMSTSFVRGITINDAIVVIDEIQNMNAGELHSVFTRIGKNCRVIIAGDIKQTDLNKNKELSGFADFIKVINHMSTFYTIEFTKRDVVRGDIVREYILARDHLEETRQIATL